MARYYCEYCHSYLTHDTLSVRKSHLVGKNHLRITADYYRNKARDENRSVFKQKRSHSSANSSSREKQDVKSVALHCSTNREKKSAARLSRAHKRELDAQQLSMLHKLYDGSPGYSKVFIDTNRLDIGDLVKANRLPQRANAATGATEAAQQTRTRDETFRDKPANGGFILEPPSILTQWSNTVPKTRIYNDNGGSLITTIDEAKKRIQKRRKY